MGGARRTPVRSTRGHTRLWLDGPPWVVNLHHPIDNQIALISRPALAAVRRSPARDVADERNDAAVEQRVKQRWPQLKKGAAPERSDLFRSRGGRLVVAVGAGNLGAPEARRPCCGIGSSGNGGRSPGVWSTNPTARCTRRLSTASWCRQRRDAGRLPDRPASRRRTTVGDLDLGRSTVTSWPPCVGRGGQPGPAHVGAAASAMPRTSTRPNKSGAVSSPGSWPTSARAGSTRSPAAPHRAWTA